jgi:hypothetical protein
MVRKRQSPHEAGLIETCLGGRANPTTTPRLRGGRCQCTACSEYFSSERAFDRHRTGDFEHGRWCIPTADLIAAGWVRNDHGFLMQPDPRRAGVDFAAPRVPMAMVLPTPCTRALETAECADAT